MLLLVHQSFVLILIALQQNKTDVIKYCNDTKKPLCLIVILVTCRIYFCDVLYGNRFLCFHLRVLIKKILSCLLILCFNILSRNKMWVVVQMTISKKVVGF